MIAASRGAGNSTQGRYISASEQASKPVPVLRRSSTSVLIFVLVVEREGAEKGDVRSGRGWPPPLRILSVLLPAVVTPDGL